MAQKFVGGALATYASLSLGGKEGFMKFEGDTYFGGSKDIAKAWRAGWINYASDFAYSSEYDFNKKSFLQRTMMFGFAGASSMMGTFFDAEIKGFVDANVELKKGFSYFGTRFISGSADYYMQQSIQVMFTNDLSKSAFNYKYRGRKMGIVSFKALHYGLFYRP